MEKIDLKPGEAVILKMTDARELELHQLGPDASYGYPDFPADARRAIVTKTDYGYRWEFEPRSRLKWLRLWLAGWFSSPPHT